ncbi:SelB C-terminal domain-containing protein [Actinocorallia sp. A-T 12471]|uniref:SelB domain-containing protein n=1 Tax=Actinocorallia sp. A-T 12471 TaxID=3089813 RepID=UPI0029CD3706|nr:SelB C-terminal domain-containing protein [Actinocorallia sp. A-T 12471]MDX6739540.1 SelB C-terminal domain-containing protein [Actinocorallia sp. A-T 12471]
MRVIATAGHVDHGKSALLRGLTGQEPDRLGEEKARGLTIDLGFVWSDELGLAFVDVPGHERFLGTMLAGVGAVPAVLFVVAADEGWRAQSAEHLAVLEALGVGHGLLAVTRTDLADPGPALAQARERMAGGPLADVPSVAVSALTGAGMPELRAALTALAASLPEPDPDGDVRLWVDRAFTLKGRGTVVTGTLGAGTLAVGDVLRVAGTGEEVRVRGLHTLGRPVERISGSARVGVNVHGEGVAGLRRGAALLTPDRWLDTAVIDVEVPGEEPPPAHVTLHVGAAGVPAQVRPLGGGYFRLTARTPLPLRLADRVVLRDPGAHRVWAARPVDVAPKPLERRRGAARRRAELLAATAPLPPADALLTGHLLLRGADLARMGAAPTRPPVAGDWHADPAHWAALGPRLEDAVRDWEAAHPHAPGMAVETARQRLALPDRALVEALLADTSLRLADGKISTGGPVPEAVAAAVAALRAELADTPFHAPEADRLRALGLDAPALAVARRAGLVLVLDRTVVLLPDAVERAVAALSALGRAFTVAEARDALATTRRTALPLLAHLDALGRTRRIDPALRVIETEPQDSFSR